MRTAYGRYKNNTKTNPLRVRGESLADRRETMGTAKRERRNEERKAWMSEHMMRRRHPRGGSFLCYCNYNDNPVHLAQFDSIFHVKFKFLYIQVLMHIHIHVQ